MRREDGMPPEADFSLVITEGAMESLIPRGSRVYVSGRAELREMDAGLCEAFLAVSTDGPIHFEVTPKS